MNSLNQNTLSDAAVEDVARSSAFRRGTSRESRNLTPTAGIGPSNATPAVAWPIKVTGPALDSPSEDVGLYPATLYVPHPTGPELWAEFDAWARAVPGKELAVGDIGLGRQIDWRENETDRAGRPVYVVMPGGGKPWRPVVILPEDGADGEMGPPGRRGARGPKGDRGKPGAIILPEDGADGEMGPPGKRGRKGARGRPQVILPENGADGDVGPPGGRGPRGLRGKRGPVGPMMLADDGADGERGPPGRRAPAPPLRAKGDIYTRTSSADAALAVGSNGQYLSADSTTATGLKWAAAPAASFASGGGAWSPGTTYSPGTDNTWFSIGLSVTLPPGTCLITGRANAACEHNAGGTVGNMVFRLWDVTSGTVVTGSQATACGTTVANNRVAGCAPFAVIVGGSRTVRIEVNRATIGSPIWLLSAVSEASLFYIQIA